MSAGCAPQLEIELLKAPELPLAPDFVKFQFFAVGDTDANEFGPFALSATPPEQFTPVPPDRPFYIDVMGCGNALPEECQALESFNARGCTPGLLTIGRGESEVVTITLTRPEIGAQVCPPSTENVAPTFP